MPLPGPWLDWRVALHAMGSLTMVRMIPVALAMLVHEI
jgi:hypothetical protein